MIEQLAGGIFCGLDGLKVLYLQYNSIIYVDTQVFSFATHLQILASNVAGLCYVDILDTCTPKFDFFPPNLMMSLHHALIFYTMGVLSIPSILLHPYLLG